MKKTVSSFLLLLSLVVSGNVLAEDHWYECGWKNFACFAKFLLPNNPDGTNQTSLVNGRDIHEWAAYEGHVYGSGNMIEFRLRFDNQSLLTLNSTSLGQPFALEVDISEANNGTRLKFDRVTHTFPDGAKAIRDIGASNDINPNANADGLLIRDTRAIKAYTDYIVRFYLKEPLPAEGVSVVPALQISYNTHYLELGAIAGHFILSPTIPTASTPHDSPWNFFPMEADSYVGPNEDVVWKLYPDGREGLVWDSKTSSRKENIFHVESDKVYDSVQLDISGRYDRIDKVCRVHKPNPTVEQFRNLATGHITIYRTPDDQTGYRYANADCGVGGFPLPASLAGDGSGSGDTSGSESGSKPNLYALDTFVTYGESASTQRVTSSDKIFLGTPLWCQMRMGNNGSADVTRYFDSACYVSVGKKFDGWNDATNLGLARTQDLGRGDTHTEHKGIDILYYPNWYNVVSKIDVNNVIVETNERDNSYNKDNPFAFQIWGRPSVGVTIGTDKSSYALGENVSATAYFSNSGANPYGKTGYVDWFVDGALTGEQDRILRENLHPGVTGKTESAILVLPQQYGTHEIKACFRYAQDDLVEEQNPADNCAVTTVTIPDPNPPVVIVAPEPPPPPDPVDTGSGGSGTGGGTGGGTGQTITEEQYDDMLFRIMMDL